MLMKCTMYLNKSISRWIKTQGFFLTRTWHSVNEPNKNNNVCSRMFLLIHPFPVLRTTKGGGKCQLAD